MRSVLEIIAAVRYVEPHTEDELRWCVLAMERALVAPASTTFKEDLIRMPMDEAVGKDLGPGSGRRRTEFLALRAEEPDAV